ncbi:transcriptional regulator NrdR [Candidatus Roizmanbacteria bacterium CG02_land_8_20_14_3_00_36_15]|uniref:Transcriptional repressor NrdR n=2 Tax=Candidatus Roizmaniibacteriota TaxID=1752723 RepID=A0A2M8KK89_9BACT|nr:MAG: transcriptional regulator NrdR [Candidatus Roizmanbacteria bacterium CG03_land_8_20_14_0_80_36_21]PIV37450.1 MAG: transcriptional regulator NrdR [Candidatus Roizmanbacteria bacterium CG02_land_8_20_14_3_00_36_15]PIY70525.1 MAG: transcriptional regulator NrdR [Candidatus Roizmanbacteria bacterium CG_4_10_14_0_8_um_filter_36_36]PJA52635.1 MAG: transcriptional regulator NrdR [Candidatus Roizmanbacteria bacterium CG_4_9_14_3_um_filter_36_11]PJC81479.1 MAG: transcriptional regulator NrdR [Ca
MFCIFCHHTDTEVIETRLSEDGTTIRRRRRCPKCQRRFTTYERVEELPILVIKRNGNRERFDREKLRRGIIKACEKTTVSVDQIEKIIGAVEKEVKQQEKTEIDSAMIGRFAAKELKRVDKIAYIRFASVFRRFVDVEDFEKEIKKLS